MINWLSVFPLTKVTCCACREMARKDMAKATSLGIRMSIILDRIHCAPMRCCICILFLTALPLQAASRLPVREPHVMVASVDAIASRIGADIMKHGGNAVDAAVAVALALAVTWPEAGN